MRRNGGSGPRSPSPRSSTWSPTCTPSRARTPPTRRFAPSAAVPAVDQAIRPARGCAFEPEYPIRCRGSPCGGHWTGLRAWHTGGAPAREEGMYEPEYPIRTERLLLRPFASGDVDALYAYHRLPEVHRYLYSQARSRAEVEALVAERAGETALA